MEITQLVREPTRQPPVSPTPPATDKADVIKAGSPPGGWTSGESRFKNRSQMILLILLPWFTELFHGAGFRAEDER
jgi:hypothetical protein